MRKIIFIVSLALLATLTVAQTQTKKPATQQQAKPATRRPGIVAAATAHQVVLSWTASTVPVGAPAVSGYNVYRGASSGTETLLAAIGNVTTYTDTAVTANTTYFYVVTGLNSAGESGKSNEVSVTIPNTVPPNAPTGLTITSSQ